MTPEDHAVLDLFTTAIVEIQIQKKKETLMNTDDKKVREVPTMHLKAEQDQIQSTCHEMMNVMVSIQNRTFDQYFQNLYEVTRDLITNGRLKTNQDTSLIDLEFDYTFFYASENFMPADGHLMHILTTRKQLELFARKAAMCINRTDMRITRLMKPEELDKMEKEIYLLALATRKLTAMGIAVGFDIPDDFDHFPAILVYSPVEQSWIVLTMRAREFE